MKRLLLFSLCLFCALSSLFISHSPSVGSATAQTRLVGGDLSMVPAYKAAGDQWLDESGAAISDMIAYVKSQGWNAVRVRIFVDPSQDSDPAVCQDYDYALALAKRVKAAGMKVLLDFHYSDTWSDPGQQRIPAGWSEDTSDATLAQTLFDYSYGIIKGMIEEGATPDYVQLGNEITYGLLWRTTDGKYPTSASDYASVGYCPAWNSNYSAGAAQWKRTASFLNNAAHGVHLAYKDMGLDSTSVKLVLHTEKHTDNYFYRHVRTAGFDNYDIIGLSYYPFWHGPLTTLGVTLSAQKSDFPEKEVQIVETAWYNAYYPYETDASGQYSLASLDPDWTADAQGQVNFLTDLADFLKLYDNVTGVYYWTPEECGNGYQKTVMKGWINRGLWKNGSSRMHAILKASDGTTGLAALATYLDSEVPEYEDASDYFTNLDFETGDMTGWVLEQTWATQWPKDISSWADPNVYSGKYTLELWNPSTPEGSIIAQAANLPNGRYTVTVKARANKDGFYLYAGGAKTSIKAATAATWSATTNVRNGVLEVGLGTLESTADNYLYADDFKVARIGDVTDDEDIDDTGSIEPSENEYTDEQGIIYTLWPESHVASVTNGKAATGDVVIPATLTVDDVTYYVNSIDPNSFYNNEALQTITIGKNVTGIWNSAFGDCWSLQRVTFAEESSITSLGTWAFYNCAIDSLDLPAGIKEIPEGAFSSCWALNYVALRGEVASIGDFAFSKWSSADSVYAEPMGCPLAGGVWIYATEAPTISVKAFSPKDVAADTLYVHYALVEDEAYTSLGFKAVLPLDESDGSLSYTDSQGVRYKLWPENGNAGVVGYDAAHAPSQVTDWQIEIPETIIAEEDGQEYTVTYIDRSAFGDHWTLTAATLPESISSIGPWAFYNTGLTSIVVYDGVTAIEEGTFGHCWNLRNAEFYGRLTSIGNFAFSSWAEEGCATNGGPLNRVVLWTTSVPEISARAFFADDVAEGVLYVDNALVSEPVYNSLGFGQVLPIDASAVEAPAASLMVNGKLSNGTCYDLAGRRVVSPRRGIYIRNHRKVVVE